MNSLYVKLLDMRDAHFDNRAQISRNGRPEISAKPFVQRFQRPHLVFADALGAFEIVT
jgi:hypothetical protein